MKVEILNINEREMSYQEIFGKHIRHLLILLVDILY